MGNITRSHGYIPEASINGVSIPVTPTNPLPGGGYSGFTEDLDEQVKKAALALQTAFRDDVEIRFNSGRRSGGAFINAEVEGVYKTVGIGVGMNYMDGQFINGFRYHIVADSCFLKIDKGVNMYEDVETVEAGVERLKKLTRLERW